MSDKAVQELDRAMGRACVLISATILILLVWLIVLGGRLDKLESAINAPAKEVHDE